MCVGKWRQCINIITFLILLGNVILQNVYSLYEINIYINRWCVGVNIQSYLFFCSASVYVSFTFLHFTSFLNEFLLSEFFNFFIVYQKSSFVFSLYLIKLFSFVPHLKPLLFMVTQMKPVTAHTHVILKFHSPVCGSWFRSQVICPIHLPRCVEADPICQQLLAMSLFICCNPELALFWTVF